jgi:hypothetical protein
VKSEPLFRGLVAFVVVAWTLNALWVGRAVAVILFIMPPRQSVVLAPLTVIHLNQARLLFAEPDGAHIEGRLDCTFGACRTLVALIGAINDGAHPLGVMPSTERWADEERNRCGGARSFKVVEDDGPQIGCGSAIYVRDCGEVAYWRYSWTYCAG